MPRFVGKDRYAITTRQSRTVDGGVLDETIYRGYYEQVGIIKGNLPASYEFDYQREGHIAELHVHRAPGLAGSGGQDFSLELRESIALVHKDVLEPAPDAPIGDLTTAQILQLKRIIDKNEDLGSGEQFSPPLSAQQLELYELIQRGVTSRIVYQPVFTINRTSARTHVWPNQTNGVGQIFTDSQMFKDQGIEGLVLWTMASSAYADIVEPDRFKFGWLKQMPWHDTTVGNRTTQVVEFQFGLWALLLHRLAE
ncbi:MAG TPA: hypothetical protein VFT34_17440 [Verrucomicrobiae bacterium]|nr:hypothetical protein [Verrucomicrobiae bacterium]